MTRRMNITREQRRLPKCIHNMIQKSYLRNDSSHQAADRINRSTIANRFNVVLTTRQVAAVYGWISLKERQ